METNRFYYNLFVLLFISIIILLTSCGNNKSESKLEEEDTIFFSTINDTLQQNIKSLLKDFMIANHNDWGSVVIMKTETGEIVSKVNLKHDLISNKLSSNYDFASAKLIFAGYLYTLPSIMACIEDGFISVADNDIVPYKDNIYIHNANFVDNIIYDADSISYKKAFQKKSNTVVARTISNNYGSNPKKFTNHLSNFGLDKPLGISWLKEPNPVFITPKSNHWSNFSLPLLSLGYENQNTPLQLLVFYNSILNNGKRIKPIVEKSKNLELPIILSDNIFSSTALESAKELLNKTNTTSQPFDSEDLISFWHSSVVKSNYDNSSPDKSEYHSIYIAFAPNNKPQYSFIIVLSSDKFPNLPHEYGLLENVVLKTVGVDEEAE